jgi:hypothetical protein
MAAAREIGIGLFVAIVHACPSDRDHDGAGRAARIPMIPMLAIRRRVTRCFDEEP